MVRLDKVIDKTIGNIFDPNAERKRKDLEKQKQQQQQPLKQEPLKPTPPPVQNKPEVIRDETTGELTGVTLPDGRVFLGLSPRDIRSIIEAERKKTETPFGAVEASQIAEQRRNIEIAQGVSEQIGQVPEQQATIEPFGAAQALEQNLPATAVQGAAGIGGAVGVPALAGALGATAATGGAAAVVGAGIALTTATFTANRILSTMASERKQQTKVESRKTSNSFKRINNIIQAAKMGADPLESINQYNAEIAEIYKAEANLKKLSEVNWANAEDELVNIESFRRNKQLYDQALLDAIARNPNTVAQFDNPFGNENETEE